MRDDRGSIVIGWLTKLAVVLGLLGLVGVEFVSVGLARLSLEDAANDVAREAATTYRQTRNVQTAYREAVEVASRHDLTIRPEEFLVERDGTVQVTVHKTVDSMFLHRFGPTKGWVELEAESRSRFSS